MTGDKNWFSSLKKASRKDSIIFGDASTSMITATGSVKVSDKFTLNDVALVENLKYNLLSVSQILWMRILMCCSRKLEDSYYIWTLLVQLDAIRWRKVVQGEDIFVEESDDEEDDELTAEHEISSDVTAPLHIQRLHPPEQIIGNIGECTTRSKILWLISTLRDYGLTFEKVPLFCDNTSAINIA
ncbi:Os10g0188500 [Oryza sativa Japonica Group]|uniref:Os10g0188500 protein n=1 Tax=Oryza sativa subsp. japonica TaxID=39947 RepID=C7J7J8_ORYSJ|nr:Os10g0188500 [Oryza sativa Japonica Group]|eukprot:NP_001176052.1 Os10g0188500 [Oryza sativa Japonica Group]